MTTLERITPLIQAMMNCHPDTLIAPETELVTLSLDDVDYWELVIDVEDTFEIDLDAPDFANCKTVADVIALVDKGLAKC